MEEKQLDFLLGALSPTGFCGYFSQAVKEADGSTAALLKAGPGCGKSTLLRRLAAYLTAQGETVELIHCSGNPDSLDGVICKSRQFSIVDATPPHALEPLYPVAFEDIVSLYAAVDRTLLQANRNKVVALFLQCKALNERAVRYITAAGSLLQDNMRVALCCTDIAKARAFAATLGRRYIPSAAPGSGHEDIRLLSAVTGKGHIFYIDTIPKLADTIVVLDDEYGGAGKAILYALRAEAIAKGYDVITCYCAMNPYEKIEHLFVPALRLCFSLSNEYHTVRLPGQRTIHCTRFCDAEGLKLRRKRLRFNKKAIAELLAQAISIQQEANAAHDALEGYYANAIDFNALEKTYLHLISELDQKRT